MWRAVIVVGIVFALLAYACIVVGARSEDNRAGGNYFARPVKCQ